MRELGYARCVSAFSEKLIKWRGNLTRFEAGMLLGVSWRTLEAWERGEHEPSSKPSMKEIERRMAETARGERNET